jgi:hypothetical protein
LERIEESAFRSSGLKSILIPSSVVVLEKESFSWCESLESVTFETGSRLERIDRSAFEHSRISFDSVSQQFAIGTGTGPKPEKDSGRIFRVQ